MSASSKIEWTQTTWNPVTGCTKISTGCLHCYAERMTKRLRAMGVSNYRNGFKVTTHEHMLECPLQWKSPKRIFVNSMSDLFHEDVSDDFILRVFEIMNEAYWHQFQVLTKRSHRLCDLNTKLHWTPNIWVGVTVEHEEYRQRIDDLRNTSANIKFLSCEPLLGPLHDLNLNDIDWVIVGGESGPGSRCVKEKWVSSLRDICIQNNIPFFFKQWGGFNKKRNGRLLQGRIWEQMPCTI